ncbi:hypothetical protein NLU13_8577 [Sarocladium strictum]|uniref:CUE domain-containing protein n=1 Tax=Sarocladium strictum TaxID=5046 RepID=A0AA39GCH3_SARSR|nr:hypothetical protein NLU13_8577 [Sarocladium strictum]
MAALPPLAAFPDSAWRDHLKDAEWDGLLIAWTTLSQAYAGLGDDDLARRLRKDESIPTFLTSFMQATATDGTSTLGQNATGLLRAVFQLTSRVLLLAPPAQLLTFDFLASLCRIYPKRITSPLLSRLFTNEKHSIAVEASFSALKKLLIPHLDSGIRGDLKLVEQRLTLLNPLLHCSPHACSVFLAGSDFLDGLISGFKVMNPPLRKVIVTTLYLCLIGLVEAEPSPKWAMLSDQLYALRMAADAHKAGPLNANDSLVPELVTQTPILKVLLRRAEASSAATENLKKRITALEEFKKGPMARPKRLIKRRVDKGKGKMSAEEAHAEMHIHKMSKITQVQDVLQDLNLGTGFIARCLDEYNDDVAQVIDKLLVDSLPPHLAQADRHESLSISEPHKHKDLAPKSPELSQLPERRNAFDDDAFDKLTMDVSKVSFGKRPEKTADQLLQDKTSAPGKAAILSALAAFDSDDDERDDTYDAADVGGTVDSANQEADAMRDGNEEILFRAYQTNPRVFARDAEIRRSAQRTKLKQETDMTDEALEGWAVMLQRSPHQLRKLEEKFAFKGEQQKLDRSAWRASPAGSGMEESDTDGGHGRGGARGGGRGRGRGRGGGGGRGGRGGSVDGPTGEKGTESARRHKEANKGSRANHNRRDARAKKVARGGFAG